MGAGSKGLKFRNQFQETRERGWLLKRQRERERQTDRLAWQAFPDLSVSISAGLQEREGEGERES